jgi:hypothetical protein
MDSFPGFHSTHNNIIKNLIKNDLYFTFVAGEADIQDMTGDFHSYHSLHMKLVERLR